jgi:hypothetical protein
MTVWFELGYRRLGWSRDGWDGRGWSGWSRDGRDGRGMVGMVEGWSGWSKGNSAIPRHEPAFNVRKLLSSFAEKVTPGTCIPGTVGIDIAFHR